MNQDAEIPDESNYFAEVHTIDRDAITAAFERDGHWSIRNTGFAEFEAQSNYGELIIEAENPVLVHGSVHPSAVKRVNEILSSIGMPWKSEIYNQEGNIVQNFDDTST